MRAHILLLIVYLCCAIQLYAIPNTNRPDSLLVTVSSQKATAIARAEAAFGLCEYYFKKEDPKKAESYLKMGKEFAKNSPLWTIVYFYYETLLYEQEDHEKAEAAYVSTEHQLKKFDSKDAYYYRASCWYNYGVLQQYKDDQKGFINIVLNKALPLAEKSGEQVFIGKVYWGLGVVFKNTTQYPQSETNLKKAIEIFKRQKSIAPNLIKAYTTITETYILEGKYSDANNALNQAYHYLNQMHAPKELWIEYFTSRGMYFTVTKDYKNSVINLQKGIDITRQTGDSYRKGRLMMQLFYSYYEAKNFDKAIETLTEMNQDKLLTVQLTNRLQIYDGYAQTYAQKGDYKNAFNWQTKYSALSDSTNASRLKEDINAMEIKFKTSEKEKTITLLQEKQKAAELVAKNKNNWIAFLVVACTLMLALAALVYSSYRKTNKLTVQKEKIHQQEMIQKEQEIKIESIRSLFEGEEKERGRLARDLHDGLGGMLASLKLKLSSIAEENNWNTTNSELSKIAIPIDNTLQELRRISRNMVPPTLLQFGLEAAIRDLCQSFSNSQTQIDFQSIQLDRSIAENDQLIIYRIVQELLTNAIKHANAKNILVQCSQDIDLFLITIEDNGKGFDENLVDFKGMGLSNIVHRVRYMNGKLDYDSALGTGTTFNIELKLNKA